jgi:hypothetical protein
VQVNIDEGFLNLMTNDGTAKDDVRVPEGDLGAQIQAGFDEGKDLLVTIISAMGEEQAISFKEAPKACKCDACCERAPLTGRQNAGGERGFTHCILLHWSCTVVQFSECVVNVPVENAVNKRLRLRVSGIGNAPQLSQHRIVCSDPREASQMSETKKYATQAKLLQEMYPGWGEDDVVSLLQETHGSVELAVERISQGERSGAGCDCD